MLRCPSHNMANNRKLVVVLSAVALLGGTAFFLLRSRDEPKPQSVGAAPAAPGTATPPAPAPVPGAAKPVAAPARDPGVAERRQALIDRVQAAQQRRLSEGLAAAVGAGTAQPTERPSLETSDVGQLDKVYIQERIQDITPLVRECYERALERIPTLAGKAIVEFAIIGEEEVGGLVESSTYLQDQSTIADPEFAECIQETMHALEFAAPPAGGGRVVVRYPFVFRSGQ